MGNRSDTWRELRQLLMEQVEGKLSVEQRRRIGQIIKDDPEARGFYLEYCKMHSMLQWEYGLLSDQQLPTSRRKKHSGMLSGRFHTVKFLTVAAAALFLIGIGVWFIFLSGNDGTLNGDDLSGPRRGDSVGRLARVSGASFAWGGLKGKTLAEGDRMPSGKYRLEGGIVEIMLDSGASAVIESPAEFSLISTSMMEFTSGRMVARAPGVSSGFTVNTPMAVIRDLGTEFAIKVDREGRGEVHVIEGEVIVTPRSGDDRPSVHLMEGNAVRIDKETEAPVGIDLAADNFIRRLSEPKSIYEKMIMELRPVAYYNIEPSSDGWTLLDVSPYANHGKVSSRKRKVMWAAGRVGSAIELSGPSSEESIVVPDYPKTNNNTLSGCAWVYARSRPRWATIAVNWGDRAGQFHMGLFNTTGQLEVHINDAGDKRVVATEDNPIPLNKWHHVAFVADGSILRLYRNGKEVASSPYTRINGSGDIRSLGIGTRLDYRVDGKSKQKKSYAFWHGKIDEIAIFNHALSGADIKRLYNAGKIFVIE